MEKKSWLKITITADPKLEEPLSDFLIGVLNAGVEMGAPGESGYGTITAWLAEESPSKQEQENIITRLRCYLAEVEAALECPACEFFWEMVEEQDWSLEWKKYFNPFAVISDLIIVPGWEEYAPQPHEQVLVMDPGMAFGTGHHDSTSFSLTLLRKALEEKEGQSVLDVGTGTGILGMGALLFGAERVVAVDNDNDAVAAALENVKRNNLAEKMEISSTPLAELDGMYDIVVANIIHDVLLLLAGDFVERLAPGGSLILSGILKGEQTESVCKFFTNRGFFEKKVLVGDEWAALWLQKAS